MGLQFRADAPVLHFGPSLPKNMRWKERRFVLWPALMYRVVAPEVRDRQLNVLQRAVLGMCRAGVTTIEAIGMRLHIHPDLAGVIVTELLDRGWINKNGLPSAQGNEIYAQESLDSGGMVTGHVFQDPWTGDLWPRFIEKLDFAELQHNPTTGFPDLILGTSGRPRRERAFMVLADDIATPPSPVVSEILRATHRHRLALRRSESYESADDDDKLARSVGIALDRVSFVDDRPMPVFVTAFIYRAETGDLATEWHACDPFGLGLSPTLRKAIERETRTSGPLRALVESMLGESLEAQKEAQRRLVSEIRAMAVATVERCLSLGARDLPQYEEIVALESVRIEAELLGDSCPEHRLRDLLGTARRALEATFQAIFRQNPPGQIWRRVYKQDRGRNVPIEDFGWLYEATAKSVGFNVPLPAALAGVLPNHVKAACYPDGGWRLRGAIMTALLCARECSNHPFRSAASKEPELLRLLNEVAEAGGAVHAGAGSLPATSVQTVVSSVYRIIGLLFGLCN